MIILQKLCRVWSLIIIILSLIIILPFIIILAICSIPLIAGFIGYAWTDPTWGWDIQSDTDDQSISVKFSRNHDIFDGNS